MMLPLQWRALLLFDTPRLDADMRALREPPVGATYDFRRYAVRVTRKAASQITFI